MTDLTMQSKRFTGEEAVSTSLFCSIATGNPLLLNQKPDQLTKEVTPMGNRMQKNLRIFPGDRCLEAGGDIHGSCCLEADSRAPQRSLEEGLLEPLSCLTVSQLTDSLPGVIQ
jgi:hypothetical protein